MVTVGRHVAVYIQDDVVFLSPADAYLKRCWKYVQTENNRYIDSEFIEAVRSNIEKAPFKFNLADPDCFTEARSTFKSMNI
jgi:ABC-type taurine transport system ATPase subunit